MLAYVRRLRVCLPSRTVRSIPIFAEIQFCRYLFRTRRRVSPTPYEARSHRGSPPTSPTPRTSQTTATGSPVSSRPSHSTESRPVAVWGRPLQSLRTSVPLQNTPAEDCSAGSPRAVAASVALRRRPLTPEKRRSSAATGQKKTDPAIPLHRLEVWVLVWSEIGVDAQP